MRIRTFGAVTVVGVLVVLSLCAGEIRAVTLPSNVVYSVPITLTNQQRAATPAPFQQMVTVNSAQYAAYEASNLQNVEFLNSNGSIIPSWLESGANSSSTASVYWLSLATAIPADSNATVYMGFASVSTNLFNRVDTGEAPQLSRQYGEYDDGANVFPYYQSWGFTGDLPSGWSAIPNTSVVTAQTYTSVGASASNCCGWYGIYETPPTSMATLPTYIEFLGSMYDSVGAGNTVGLATSPDLGDSPAYALAEGGSPPNLVYFGNDNNQYALSTSYSDSSSPKVYSIGIANSSSSNVSVNYAQVWASDKLVPTTPAYFVMLPSHSVGGLSTPISVYWLRTRAYPPDGVMPKVNIGSGSSQSSSSQSSSQSTSSTSASQSSTGTVTQTKSVTVTQTSTKSVTQFGSATMTSTLTVTSTVVSTVTLPRATSTTQLPPKTVTTTVTQTTTTTAPGSTVTRTVSTTGVAASSTSGATTTPQLPSLAFLAVVAGLLLILVGVALWRAITERRDAKTPERVSRVEKISKE